jgi:chromosome segregation ATPase
MAGLAFARTVSDCELLKGALEPLLGELPHLNAENAELETFLSEVKSLNQRQQDLTAQLRQVNRLRKEAELRGQDLRGRIAAQLRGKLGFKNESLLKFGIPPRRKRERRKKEETPPVEKPTATAEEPPTTQKT